MPVFGLGSAPAPVPIVKMSIDTPIDYESKGDEAPPVFAMNPSLMFEEAQKKKTKKKKGDPPPPPASKPPPPTEVVNKPKEEEEDEVPPPSSTPPPIPRKKTPSGRYSVSSIPLPDSPPPAPIPASKGKLTTKDIVDLTIPPPASPPPGAPTSPSKGGKGGGKDISEFAISPPDFPPPPIKEDNIGPPIHAPPPPSMTSPKDITGLQGKLKDTNKELEDVKEKLKASEGENQMKRQEMADMKRQVQDLRDELNKLQSSIAGSEESNKKGRDSAASRISKLEGELETALREIIRLRGEKEEERINDNEGETTKGELLHQISTLTSENESLRKTVEECGARTENEAFNVKIESLMKEVEASKAAKAKAVSVVLSLISSEEFLTSIMGGARDEASVRKLKDVIDKRLALSPTKKETGGKPISPAVTPEKKVRLATSSSPSRTTGSPTPVVLKGRTKKATA